MNHTARPLWRPVFAVISALAAVIAVPPAKATPVLFSTGRTNVQGVGPVDAQATFVIDSAQNQISATVYNLLDDPSNAGQLVSSVQFSISPGQLPNQTPSIQSSDGTTEINIDKTTDLPSAAVPQSPIDWAVQKMANFTFLLCVVCQPGTVQTAAPAQLLIGNPGKNGLYSSANSSITGRSHQPVLLASGPWNTLSGLDASPKWVLKIPQLTPTSKITSVAFGFGTTYGSFETGYELAAVPEPTSWTLLPIGLFLICLGCIRIRIARRSPR